MDVPPGKTMKMQISKLSIPLASVCPVTCDVVSTKNSLCYSSACIGVLPIKEMLRSGKISFWDSTAYPAGTYWVPPLQCKFETLRFQPNHAMNPVHLPSEEEYERALGYHEFSTVNDFLAKVSGSLSACIQESGVDGAGGPEVKAQFEIHSDNTISLHVTSPIWQGQYSYVIPYHPAFSALAGSQRGKYFLVYANEYLVKKLRSLPWMKCAVNASTQVAGWTEPYIYFLDTSQGQVSDVLLAENGIMRINFPQSDATSICDIHSFVLMMTGAGVTNQVLPVNIAPTSEGRNIAQVTSVPVVEMYYPMWSRPSDLSTDLVVKNDDFVNGGPMTLSPSFFNERNLKFKMVYVTTDGRMHEMVIPTGSCFSFQLTIFIV